MCLLRLKDRATPCFGVVIRAEVAVEVRFDGANRGDYAST